MPYCFRCNISFLYTAFTSVCYCSILFRKNFDSCCTLGEELKLYDDLIMCAVGTVFEIYLYLDTLIFLL